MQLAKQVRKKNDPGIQMGTGVPMNDAYQDVQEPLQRQSNPTPVYAQSIENSIEAPTLRDPYVRRLLTICEDNRSLREYVETAVKNHRRLKVLLRLTILIMIAGFCGGATAGYMAYERLNDGVVAISTVEETTSFNDSQLEQISQAVSGGISAYEEEKKEQAEAEKQAQAKAEALKKAQEEEEQKASQKNDTKKKQKSKDAKNDKEKESEDSE